MNSYPYKVRYRNVSLIKDGGERQVPLIEVADTSPYPGGQWRYACGPSEEGLRGFIAAQMPAEATAIIVLKGEWLRSTQLHDGTVIVDAAYAFLPKGVVS